MDILHAVNLNCSDLNPVRIEFSHPFGTEHPYAAERELSTEHSLCKRHMIEHTIKMKGNMVDFKTQLKLIVTDQDSMHNPLRYYLIQISMIQNYAVIICMCSASVKIICDLQKGGFSTIYLAFYVPTKEICVVR